MLHQEWRPGCREHGKYQYRGPLLQECAEGQTLAGSGPWPPGCLPCGLLKRRLPSTPRTPTLPPLWHLGEPEVIKKEPFPLKLLGSPRDSFKVMYLPLVSWFENK